MNRHEIGIFFRSSGLRSFVGALDRVRGRGRDFDSVTKSATRSSRAVKAYGTATERATKSTKTQSRTLRTSAKEAGVLARAFETLTRRQRENSAASSRQSSALGQMARSIGAVVLTVFSLTAALGQLRGAVQTFAEFENRMSAVQAVTGSTTAQLDQLEAVSRRLGETTVFSAAQAAEAEEAFGRAGFATLEIVRALPATLDLAAAAQLSMADAASTTGNLLRAFNLEAAETGRVSDVLAKAASSANTTVLQLGEQFKFLGPVAANLGKSIEESAGALAVLANQGLADISGTALRRIFSGLVNPTNEAKKTIESMGLTLEELDPTVNSTIEIMERLAEANVTAGEAFSIAGQRGGPALLALTSQIDQLRELTKAIGNSAGAAEAMSIIMRDNVRGDALELRSVLEELKITFGEAFAPALRASLDELTAFFAANKDAARAFGEAIGNMARVVTAALIALGNNFNVVLLLIASFVASKLLLWLTALGASLAKRVIDWGRYTTATGAATGATNAAAVAAGRAVTLYGAQGQALKTVALSTAAAGAATGAATAATWSFSAAVRGLTAAIAANPIGLIVIALTLLITTFGSVVGSVSAARAETEAYHAELEEGRPIIEGVSASHDRYADTLEKERSNVESLHAQSLRLRNELEQLKPAADELGKALETGDEVSYLRLVQESKELRETISRIGKETAFEKVSADVELLNARLEANQTQLEVARLKAMDAERSLAQVAEQALAAEQRRLAVTKARLAETRVELLKAQRELQKFIDIPALRVGAQDVFRQLQQEVKRLGEEAELAAEGVEKIRDRIEDLVEPLGTKLGDLLGAGDIEGILNLLNQLPDEIFGEVAFTSLPPEFARAVAEGEQSLIDAFVAAAAYSREQARLAAEARKNAAAQARLNQEIAEQTERFKALKGSLEAETAALGRLTRAALKGEEAFTEAARAAEVERRFRAESAKLAKLNKDVLDELRAAIVRVIDAEARLAGARTISSLERQAAGLSDLVDAYDDSALAALAVQEALELEAEVRENVADAAAEQRAKIERLTKSVKELNVAAAAAEDVRALEDEIDALEGLSDAFDKGAKAAKDFSRQLEIQDQIHAKTEKLLAQRVRLMDQLAEKQELLTFLESNMVIGGQAFATVLRSEIDLITQQLNLNEEQRIALEERIRQVAELTDKIERQGLLAALEEENQLLQVELEALQNATRAEREMGIAAREAAIAVEVQRQIMAHGAEGIEEYEAALRAAISENEGLRTAIDQTGALSEEWVEVGRVIADVAGQISDDLGRMLTNVLDLISGFQQLQSAQGVGQAAVAGAGFGASVAGLGQSLGVFQGRGGQSSFGGALEGDYSAEGGVIGGVIGAVVGSFIPVIGTALGGIIGSVLGSVIGSFVKSGADEALSTVEQIGDDLVVRIDKAEGNMRPAIEELSTTVVDVIEGIEDAINTSITTGIFGFKIREETISVFINGITGTFTDMQDAIEFAVKEVLSTAQFGKGIGDSVRQVLESGAFEDLNELTEGLNLASLLDRGTAAARPFADAMQQIAIQRNREIRLARQFGLAMDEVLDLTNERIALTRKEITSQLNQMLGVQDYLGVAEQFANAVNDFNQGLQDELDARNRNIEALQAQHAAFSQEHDDIMAQIEALGGIEAVRQQALAEERQAAQDLRDGIAQTEGESMRLLRRLLEVEAGMASTAEEIAALEASLADLPDAIDTQAIVDAFNIGGINAGLDLIAMLQQIQGEQFLAVEAQELQAQLYLLQLAAQIAAVKALLEATDLLSDATRELLQGIVDSAEDIFEGLASGEIEFPTAGRGLGGRSNREQRQRERSEIIRDIEQLRLAAAGVEESTIALRNSFRDFDEWVERARELGIAEETIAQARADNLAIIEEELLAPFEEIVAQAGESGTQTGIRHMAEEFQVALSDAFALAEERAQTFGTTVADEFPRLRDTILEAFGIQLGDELRDQISSLAASGDVGGLQDLIADLLATDLSGISPDLQRQFQELLNVLIAEAELAVETLESNLADTTGGFSVEFDFSPIQEFLDLADGLSEVDTQLRGLQQTFAGVIAEATLAGATEEDLARIRMAHAAAIGAVREAVLENVQEYTDAAQGISELDRELMNLREGFEAARDGVLATDQALRDLGEEASSTDDLQLLSDAYRQALLDVRDGILESVQSYTDAVEGIGEFERRLLDLQETFSTARTDLESVDDALAGADDVFSENPLDVVATKFVESADLIAQEIEPALIEVRDAFDLGMSALVGVVKSRMGELGISVGELEVKPGGVGPAPGGFRAGAPTGVAELPILLGGVETAAISLEREVSDLTQALGEASGSTSELSADLDLLDAAERRAIQSLGVDFINSLEQLGVSLPTELVRELAQAEFELAKANAISSALALAAAGAFQDLSISLDELLDLISGAEFDFDPTGPSPDGGGAGAGSVTTGGGGGGGGTSPGEDLDALRQQVLDQIEAWNRLPLGEVTNQAIGLRETLVQLRADAERAGVAVEEVNAAFQVALDSFVNDALSPFEDLSLNPLQRELDSLIDQFVDLLVAFETAGADAEQMVRLQETFATAMDDFLERATSGIRNFLDELLANDPQVGAAESFQSAQTEFRDLLAAAQGGDLEALSQLEGAARRFREQALGFLGGGVGTQEVLDEIIAGLGSVEDFELVPEDIALLRDQADALLDLIKIGEAQPTVDTQQDGFDGVSSSFTTSLTENDRLLRRILDSLARGTLSLEEIPEVLAQLNTLANNTEFLPANVGGILAALTGVLEVSDGLAQAQIEDVLGAVSGILTVQDDLSGDQLSSVVDILTNILGEEEISAEQLSAAVDALLQIVTGSDLTADNMDAVLGALTGILTVSDQLTQDQIDNVLAGLAGVLTVADTLAPEQLDVLLSAFGTLTAMEGLTGEQQGTLVQMLTGLLALEGITDEQRGSIEAMLMELGVNGDLITATNELLTALDSSTGDTTTAVDNVLAALGTTLSTSDTLTQGQVAGVISSLGTVLTVSDTLSAQQLDSLSSVIGTLLAMEGINDEQRATLESMLSTVQGTLDVDNPNLDTLPGLGASIQQPITSQLAAMESGVTATFEGVGSGLTATLTAVEGQLVATLADSEGNIVATLTGVEGGITTSVSTAETGITAGLASVEGGVSGSIDVLGTGISSGLDILKLGVNKSVSTLSDGVADFRANMNQVINQARNQITGVDRKAARIETRASAIDSKAGTISSRTNGIDNKTNAINSRAGSIDNKTSAILADTSPIGSLSTTINGLSSSVGTMSRDVSGLSSNISSVSRSVSGLSSDISSVSRNVGADIGFVSDQIRDGFRELSRDIADIPQAQTGAFVKDDGLVFVHANERILNPSQTAEFERLGGLEGLSMLSGAVDTRLAAEVRPADRKAPLTAQAIDATATARQDRAAARREARRRRRDAERLRRIARRRAPAPVVRAPRTPQPPAPPPAPRRGPAASVPDAPPPVVSDPTVRDSRSAPPPDDPDRINDLAEVVDGLDNSRTVDGLEEVRAEVEKNAKERRKEEQEKLKMAALKLAQGTTMVETMSAVLAELESMRRDRRIEANSQPVGKAN